MSCWRHRLRIALVCLAAWCGNAEACPTTGVALTPIGELRKGAPEPARQGNSVSVCGQVTLRPGDLPDDPGNFYIQDSTGGISVVAVKPPSYRRGEWVLVMGRATVEDETEPEITAKWLAYAGPGRMPPPRKASLREISTGKMDGWYVSVTGKVLQLATNDVRDNLVLASEAEKLEVYSRRRRGSPSALSDLTPIGAKVEIRGVAMPTSVGSPSRVRFRNSLDLLLIESPAWLETSEGQMAALAAVIVVLTALGWIVALRQAVRRQTAEIRKLLELAETASRLKSEFVANMSHEIRTPIHAMIGLQQMALDETNADCRRQYLESAHNASTHLLALLNGILDLAALDKGAIKVGNERMSPAQVVHEAAGMFETVAAAKGLSLVWRDDGLPSEVMGDPLRLKQILVNLLGNAVKFTAKGTIRVRAKGVAEDGGWRLHFAVADTGIGIAERELKHVFEEFRQADGSIRRNYGGSGVGLALASRLAAMLGGAIEVKSREGKGSTFHFSISCGAISKEPRAAVEHERADTQPQQLNLLLVEDNGLNQIVATRLLEKEGHKVEVAENGLCALAACGRSKYDAILMDVQMPVMDGLSATREIRTRERTDDRTPILALSAHTSERDRQACEAAGMDGLLSKPFSADQLRKALVRIVPRRPDRTGAAPAVTSQAAGSTSGIK